MFVRERGLLTVVGSSILKYWIQRLNRRTSDLSAKGANVECRRYKLLGESRGMLPWEIFKIRLSKMQFPTFPGPELM